MQMPSFLSNININEVAGVVSIIVLKYLIPALKAHTDASKATATNNNLDVRTKLRARLSVLFGAEAIKLLETQFPMLVLKIQSGQLKTKADLMVVVRSWMDALKQDAKEHYTPQNIDLAKHLGETAIDKLIATELVKLPQFQGNTAMAAQLTSIVNRIVETAVTVAPVCNACIPPCDHCPLHAVEPDKASTT